MAKSEDGFFGKLSGKIGNVIVSSWKGVPYIKSKAEPYTSNTEAQQNQRSKFGMVIKFLNKIKPVINAGFKWNTERMTEMNSATSYIMKQAIRGEKPNLWIDFPSVLVARGDLPHPQEAVVERDGNKLTFQWKFNADLGSKRAKDEVLALAYCPELKEGVWSVSDGILRSDEELQLSLPGSMAGKEVEIYLAFADAEGNDASDSVYLGSV